MWALQEPSSNAVQVLPPMCPAAGEGLVFQVRDPLLAGCRQLVITDSVSSRALWLGRFRNAHNLFPAVTWGKVLVCSF